ncbi:MAG: hypothetical protein MSH33_03730 [Fusobacterium necrophorum]|nr:hypothetical protein [Fusobacterium necrophorum]
MIEIIKLLSEKVKQPTTIEQQIQILKSRNVIIDDEETAVRYLKLYNYYFITGYLHPYKNKKEGKICTMTILRKILRISEINFQIF